MKKLFSLFAASALVLSVAAQKGPAIQKNLTFAKKNVTIEKESVLGPVQESKIVGQKTFTSSVNGYTLLSGRKMHADQQSKTVVYTSRAGGAFGGTGNDIKMSFTNDYGTSFDSVMFANTILHRYPGGTLFRTAAGLFTWCSGPITTTGWSANFMFTSKIDRTLAFDTTFINPPATEVGSFMMNDELIYIPTGEGFVFGEKSGPATTYDHINYSIWKLKWNEGTSHFNFVDSTEIKPLLSTVQPPVQPTGMAFSQDGTVGYFWMNGMDSITRPNQSTQPLVWKTTNQGTTWTQMPIYDFSQVQEFKDYVWPTLLDSTVMRPVFFYGYTTSDKNMPGVVDASGNLHLLVNVQGGYSVNPDSLGFSFLNEQNKLFDLYTTSTGWSARFLDTLSSAVDDGTGSAFGTFALDHRLHIGKTEDGTKLFYSWTDNLVSDAITCVLPEIYAQAHNLTTNLSTPTRNFTSGTSLTASCIYYNASDIILDDAGTYTIPAVVVSGSDPDNTAIGHIYVSGLSFTDADFVSVNNIEKNIATISSVYPNPSNGLTSVDVTLDKNANVSIDVVNMMGQIVYSQNFGSKSIGVNKLTINATDLTSGIYFVTVKAGNSSSTGKMIVK